MNSDDNAGCGQKKAMDSAYDKFMQDKNNHTIPLQEAPAAGEDCAKRDDTNGAVSRSPRDSGRCFLFVA